MNKTADRLLGRVFVVPVWKDGHFTGSRNVRVDHLVTVMSIDGNALQGYVHALRVEQPFELDAFWAGIDAGVIAEAQSAPEARWRAGMVAR